MSVRKDEKLNQLIRVIPEGVAVPSTWLTAHGYTPQLVQKYLQSGWLTRLGSRVYSRPGQPVAWEGVMLGLQRLGGFQLHLGGVSALNRQGLAHYLPLGDSAVVHAWGRKRAPGWVEQLPLDVHWHFHRRKLFDGEAEESWVELPAQVRDWTIRGSAPERAILEVLSQLDETPASFTFAAELFEGLTSLRPDVVNSLLQTCIHNEAKRLFLFFASRYEYPWTKRVDVDAVDLGRGKRLVTRGGKLDRRFQITVPGEFYAG